MSVLHLLTTVRILRNVSFFPWCAQERFSSHPIWSHAVSQSPLFRQFQSELLRSIATTPTPANILHNQALPKMNEKVDNLHVSHHQQMTFLRQAHESAFTQMRDEMRGAWKGLNGKVDLRTVVSQLPANGDNRLVMKNAAEILEYAARGARATANAPSSPGDQPRSSRDRPPVALCSAAHDRAPGRALLALLALGCALLALLALGCAPLALRAPNRAPLALLAPGRAPLASYLGEPAGAHRSSIRMGWNAEVSSNLSV
ncbi:hypothetical protein BDK51DRAFT_50021 [Blyttiomyces helicus]|uniref:Uncharacterized protein n=1 Tax=Blyttiomyces helicus TaxID=388810 RepID=A0A4V1IPK4_9FUNG|nr:hypothetical protein BDK51DRAFT_50021 [Blyttiomyces helicus]|eukprot:RKO83367.1 hypothetical protein BDK51DRAFT_50021 [Blyttiomyces helicus]